MRWEKCILKKDVDTLKNEISRTLDQIFEKVIIVIVLYQIIERQGRLLLKKGGVGGKQLKKNDLQYKP